MITTAPATGKHSHFGRLVYYEQPEFKFWTSSGMCYGSGRTEKNVPKQAESPGIFANLDRTGMRVLYTWILLARITV